MDTSRIIKLSAAGLIAILLAAGILYVKLKQDKSSTNGTPQAKISESEKSAEETLYESISAPVAKDAPAQAEISPEVQASISAPTPTVEKPQPEVSQDILSSLSAPVK
jgi:hypothetical protein